MDAQELIGYALDHVRAWEESWGPFERHPAQRPDVNRLRKALGAYLGRLEGNYPFFHPRYAGQMLKPPHAVAVAGYLAAQWINPNNHALDGGPPTGQMEKEVMRDLGGLFGFPDEALGHLTSSGTIANLEALWVARELHPERGIAYSTEAHYTHGRMSQVLRMPGVTVPVDDRGRMRLDALEETLRGGRVGTVVLTAGTTGLGAVDAIADALPLCREHGVRVHVDAAYGGFFALLAGDDGRAGLLAPDVAGHFRAMASCDSVVVDPHKHGLQPYGCGAVLFRDASVGRFYRHDSPYTYFTSDALHLGEISLECSRAGAAAGALWLTLQVLPLRADEGLGPILAAGIRAARRWHALLDASEALAPYLEPELDILTFLPRARPFTASVVDAASKAVFERAMNRVEEPIFLSLLRADAGALPRHLAGLEADRETVRILRSVLMKPEHEAYVDRLHTGVEACAAAVATGASALPGK